MRIKRFLAPDMRRAIQLVRQEHGPDALILSSRSVDDGVEIVSALDYDQNLFTEIAEQALADRAVLGVDHAASGASGAAAGAAHCDAADGRQTVAAAPAATTSDVRVRRTPTGPANQAGSDAQLKELQRELAFMKEMLREQFAHLAWADMRTFRPERAVLKRRAEALGLEPDLIAALVEEAAAHDEPGKAWRALLLGLARRLRVLADDPVDVGGVIALVGPTGVGKTTTIAKLAARHCLEYGQDSIALVSTDNLRVGAQRQLDAFGVILGVPVRRAESPAALDALLHEQRHRRLTLIDTAGLAPRDERLTGALGSLHANPAVRTFLVLAASMQTSVLRDAVQRFGGDKLAGAVLTKLDEANGIGGALSALIEHNLPVAWVSEGQRVPEDLKLARQAVLVAAAASAGIEEQRSAASGQFVVAPRSEASHA